MPDNYLIDDPSIPLISMKEILKDLMWYGKGPIFVLIGSEFLDRRNIEGYLKEEMRDGAKICGLRIIEERYRGDNLILFEINSYGSNFHYTDKLKRLDNFIYESMFEGDTKEVSKTS